MEKSPDAFRTISEVAEHLETPAHVLRFWESRFPQIRPVKRAGGRRYYRPADVALLTGIKRLLHDEGMTIRGVQKILREQGVRFVSGMADETSSEEDDAALEAALAASVGGEAEGDAPAAPMPHAEAESAQVIALQSALAASVAPKAPEAEPDVIAEPAEEAGTAPEEAEIPVTPLPEDPAPGDPAAIAAEAGAEIAAESAEESIAAPEVDAPPAETPTEAPAAAPKPAQRLTASPRRDGADDLPDLFSRLAPSAPLAPPAAEADLPEEEPAATVEIIDFQPSVPQRPVPPAEAEPATKAEEPPEEIAEAPMAVWAEEGEHLEDDAPASAEVTPLPRAPEPEAAPVAAPMLRVTRIGPVPGTAPPPAPRVPDLPGESSAPATADETPDPLAGLAARLRRTDPGSLAASDRSAITVLRARARSLRDRLSAPHRPSSTGG